MLSDAAMLACDRSSAGIAVHAAAAISRGNARDASNVRHAEIIIPRLYGK